MLEKAQSKWDNYFSKSTYSTDSLYLKTFRRHFLKRPTGFTILSLLLGWLAVAGFANAVIHFKSNHGSILMGALAFFYGVTALTSTIGLWKLKSWAYRSFLAWSIVVVATLLAFQFGMYRTPLLAFLGFSALILVLLAMVAIYIKNNLPATSQA